MTQQSSPIHAGARAEIDARLDRIRAEEGIEYLFAIESGSRAWGFASSDSDYDVRFVYRRSPDWYLSIDLEQRRDVIERPIVDEFDFGGWDLRKALQLLRKCNPPLLEWLNSPIVYRADRERLERLRDLIPHCYSVPNLVYHYHRMALKNYHKYLRAEQVVHKKYFYTLRALLAIRWLERESGTVPMEFGRLYDAAALDDGLQNEIEDLLARKRNARETDAEPRIPAIHCFIEAELDRLQARDVGRRLELPDPEPLNQYFRWAIQR